jgi:drug/metabolite transporter (DMT)-like permease
MRNPLVLLLLVGGLLAANITLVKAAAGGGASPIMAALVSTAGAGLLLLAVSTLTNGRPAPVRGRLTFFVVAGGVSYAFPNALVFVAADRVGPAYAAILYTFVPGITYLVALLWRIETWAARRVAGLVVGLVGAVLIVTSRFELATAAETFWLLAALAAPVSVAVGNVVRSRYWPAGASPLDIAPGLLLAAGGLLSLLLAASPAARGSGGAPGLTIAILAVSTLFYALYFRLQHVAGAVYLSQIGYVAAGAGLVLGHYFFDEPVNAAMLAGLGLVVLGVLLVRPARTEVAGKQPALRPDTLGPQGVRS